MGLLNISSANSIWKGLDYYQNKKVIDYRKITNYEYIGTVEGTTKKKYNVSINIEHPRKSVCNCPHAKDKRVICKHMVALYFTVFPKEIAAFLKEVEEGEKKYNEYKEETYKKTIEYLNKLTKEELKETIIDLLEISPEWIYEKFIKEKVNN